MPIIFPAVKIRQADHFVSGRNSHIGDRIAILSPKFDVLLMQEFVI